MHIKSIPNTSAGRILGNCLVAFIALFFNGLGVFLTINASIGAGPWDVFQLGLSGSLGILYGTASIAVSLTVLFIDILMKEPVGIAMFIDAFTVGKAVDFFQATGRFAVPKTLVGGIAMMLCGLVIMGYTQLFYMNAALGCGPRDTLLVGLAKRMNRLPIGVVSIIMLSAVTFIGWLLGGPVGIGTIICALCAGPIMQFAFFTLGFDAKGIRHQRLRESAQVFASGRNK